MRGKLLVLRDYGVTVTDNGKDETAALIAEAGRHRLWKLTTFPAPPYNDNGLPAVVPMGIPTREVAVHTFGDHWYRVDLVTRRQSLLRLPPPLSSHDIATLAWSANRLICYALDKQHKLWDCSIPRGRAILLRDRVAFIHPSAGKRFVLRTTDEKLELIEAAGHGTRRLASQKLPDRVDWVDALGDQVVYTKGAKVWITNLASGGKPSELSIGGVAPFASGAVAYWIDPAHVLVCAALWFISDSTAVGVFDTRSGQSCLYAAQGGGNRVLCCLTPTQEVLDRLPAGGRGRSPGWTWSCDPE